MRSSILAVILLALGSLPGFALDSKDPNYLFEAAAYPNFLSNPYLDEPLRQRMAPHLLPLDHPVKELLDAIFSQSRAVEDEESLLNAGFSIIAHMPVSFVVVARHPAVPGYVFKLYFDSETRIKKGKSHSEWLVSRCIGAQNIRKVIQKKQMRHFTVPDKWLYILPLFPFPNVLNPQAMILVATDMQIENVDVTRQAWKSVKKKQLNELYTILKNGYGSTTLAENVPLTIHGKFAFIDTEHAQRSLNLKKVKAYLSDEMRDYWSNLVK